MAKQFTVTVSINGASPVSGNVTVKDSELVASPAFYFRVFKAFGMQQGDVFTISAISGPTTVSDPMSWLDIPTTLIIVINALGQISLAFID